MNRIFGKRDKYNYFVENFGKLKNTCDFEKKYNTWQESQ